MSFYKDSLPNRILAFFRENPEEYLSYDDICAKFSTPRNTAMTAVSRLKDQGMLDTAIMVRPTRKVTHP